MLEGLVISIVIIARLLFGLIFHSKLKFEIYSEWDRMRTYYRLVIIKTMVVLPVEQSMASLSTILIP